MEIKAKRLRGEGYVTVDYNALMRRVNEIDFQALVDSVRVELRTLKIGDTVKVRDLDIARDKDIVLMTDPDTPVVAVTAVHTDV